MLDIAHPALGAMLDLHRPRPRRGPHRAHVRHQRVNCSGTACQPSLRTRSAVLLPGGAGKHEIEGRLRSRPQALDR
jgi:hypothetical protein